VLKLDSALRVNKKLGLNGKMFEMFATCIGI
jgi:hypothetical protein